MRIVRFALPALLNIWFWDVFVPMRVGYKRGEKARLRYYIRKAREFRDLAVTMQGVLIKIGQFASSRADVLPQEVIAELADLQDEVPPFPFEYVRRTIETELETQVKEVFATFEEVPVAAASLGQVHHATLPDGRAVAVKVQRPYIEDFVTVDLRAVRWVIGFIKNHPIIKRRADLDGLLDEFAEVLWQELDYIAEAHNAETFKANNAIPGVYFPQPLWDYTTKRVLALEHIEGIKINDYTALDTAGVDRRAVASRFLRCHFQQTLVDGFFHADPHPGNLFINVDPVFQEKYFEKKPDHGSGQPFTLIFVDFGMVGRLPPETQAASRKLVLALIRRDIETMVDAFYELDFVLPGADRQAIVTAFKLGLEQAYYGRTLEEIREFVNSDEVFALADEFTELLYDLPFQIPQNYIYFGRSVAISIGIATGLYAALNPLQELTEFMQEEVVEKQKGGEWLRQLWEEIREYLGLSIALPRNAQRLMERAYAGELEISVGATRAFNRRLDRIERRMQKLIWALLASALLISGVLLLTSSFIWEGRTCLLLAILFMGAVLLPDSKLKL